MKRISSQIFLRLTWSVILLIWMLCFEHPDSVAQSSNSKKKIRVRMSLEYFNEIDKSRSLVATLFYIEERVRTPVVNGLVTFYLGETSDEHVIDSILTDENGEARLILEEDSRFAVDDDRYFHISASYEGNSSYTPAKSDISLKDISMELFLIELNGEKTISVRAYELGNDKELVPVEDADVNFYVPRLFSDQLVGEGKVTEGKCSILFPENIAGDTIGNISIIARIEDNDDYGTITRQINDFRWGNTQPIEEDKSLMTIEITIPTRALWHTNAPLWMIITLIVLLTGVWSHYIYVIYQLIKLKRLGKNDEINDQVQ